MSVDNQPYPPFNDTVDFTGGEIGVINNVTNDRVDEALSESRIDRIKVLYRKLKGQLSPELNERIEADIDGERFIDIEDLMMNSRITTPARYSVYDNGDAAFEKFRNAANYLRIQLQKGAPLSLDLIKKVNELVMADGVEGSAAEHAGVFRSRNVLYRDGRRIISDKKFDTLSKESKVHYIAQSEFENLSRAPYLNNEKLGSNFDVQYEVLHKVRFPRPEHIEALMVQLIDDYNFMLKNDFSPIAIAADIQRRLVAIHPFANGNGRTSRLIMDFILESLGLPPATHLKTTQELSLTEEDWRDVVFMGVTSTFQNTLTAVSSPTKIISSLIVNN